MQESTGLRVARNCDEPTSVDDTSFDVYKYVERARIAGVLRLGRRWVTDNTRKFETINLAALDRVPVITLNRPRRLNAINDMPIAEVHAALDAIEVDDTLGAVVVKGAGRAFCSGLDLKDDAESKRSSESAWRELYRPRRSRGSPHPTSSRG